MINFIRGYFKNLGVELRYDKENLVKCPFHKEGREKNPSCSISLSKGMYYCFTCKEGGNLTKLAKKLGFNVQEQGGRVNLASIATKQFRDLWNNDEAVAYANRGFISDFVIKNLMWGYDKKEDAITLPIFSQGSLVGIKLRHICDFRRYSWQHKLFTPLYVPFKFLPRLNVQSTLYIVSGFWDVATMLEWGFFAVCSSISETSFTPTMVDSVFYLKNKFSLDKVVIVCDNDLVGKKSSLEIAGKLVGMGLKVNLDIVGLSGYPKYAKDICDLREIENFNHLETVRIQTYGRVRV